LTTKKTIGQRLDVLDLVRIFAALSVVFYHYLYRGWITGGLSSVDFGHYDGFFKYGYLGVQLFFIISGFLVTMSAEGRTWQSFIIGRIGRLFPAYWTCLLVTLFFIYFVDDGRFYITILEAVANLTMISKLFGVPFVDGAYWTLIYELVFYFWIFILLITKACSILFLMGVLLLLSLTSYIFDYSGSFAILYGGEFICYFAAGVCFFEFYKGNRSFLIISVFIASLLLMCLQVTNQAISKNINIGSELSVVICLSILASFLLFFILLSKGVFDRFQFRYATLLGGLSYPCYLLHQNIGYIIFNKYDGIVNDYLLLLIVLSGVVGISYIIFKYIEPPLAKYIILVGRKALR
jgi:peptidoglycan/LPS O-acetylase OafA/YrhL